MNVPQRPGGVLLGRLHTGHIPSSTPERGSPRHTSQQGPLLGPGLPPWRHTSCTLTLYEETCTFPHQSDNNLRQG